MNNLFQVVYQKTKSIPTSVWALGWVSMFMDASTEMVYSLLPVFMVTTLGASMTSIGIIEGVAESLVFLSQLFSGIFSDFIGRRKIVVLAGYMFATISKLIYPRANSILTVFTARFIDRIGKGIRSAPRDALIGEFSNNENRGVCFGLRQSMDSMGAVLGPIIAIILMWLLHDNIRGVFYFAIIPAVICIWIVIRYVRESSIMTHTSQRNGFNLRAMKLVDPRYWRLLFITALLMIGRMSDAFLVLKASSVGLSIGWIPLVFVLMNLVDALLSYPTGIISDFLGRKKILAIGIGFMITSAIVLAFSKSVAMAMLGVVLWGMYLGFSQGMLAALVSDLVKEPHIRGTSYGIFNCVCGFSILIGNILAGGLWDNFGATGAYCMSATFGLLGLLGLIWIFSDGHRATAHSHIE